MIIRTSYGEIGHCDKCLLDLGADDLWELELDYCPKCHEPLYTADNSQHSIYEDKKAMETEHWERFEKWRDKMIADRIRTTGSCFFGRVHLKIAINFC